MCTCIRIPKPAESINIHINHDHPPTHQQTNRPQLVLESLKAAANPNGGAGKGGSKGPAPHCRPPLLVMEECNASFKVATCSVHKASGGD